MAAGEMRRVNQNTIPEEFAQRIAELTKRVAEFSRRIQLIIGYRGTALRAQQTQHTVSSHDDERNSIELLTENDFVIATTKEKLTIPDDIVGHLHGKSSLARLGIVVHSTAARFDPGWDGCPVLEFGTFLRGKKIVIYEGSPICAFSFEKLTSKTEKSYKDNPYTYSGSRMPEVSNISRRTPGIGRRSK